MFIEKIIREKENFASGVLTLIVVSSEKLGGLC